MRWIHDRCATFAILVLAIVLAACGGGGTPSPSPTPVPQPVQPPALTGTPDQNADALIAVMTTDEKIQLVHGTGYTGGPELRGAAGYVPGIAHLNIPDLYLADGSVGVGNSVGQATALPSSIASAASWDLNEAYKYGQVIGAESKALGMNVNLGGNVNLIGREPRCGRTFETAGEDPLLAGRIKAQHLKAIQDQNVIAGIKHFAAERSGDLALHRRCSDRRTWRAGKRSAGLRNRRERFRRAVGHVLLQPDRWNLRL